MLTGTEEVDPLRPRRNTLISINAKYRFPKSAWSVVTGLHNLLRVAPYRGRERVLGWCHETPGQSSSFLRSVLEMHCIAILRRTFTLAENRNCIR